jgi:type IV pilus assembly protein PilZ
MADYGATAPGESQRKDPRTPIELEVTYRRLNRFISDYTRNVSKGGMFVASDEPLPVGTRVVFHLRIPGRQAPFELTGEIVHAGDARGGSGMGVRFVWEDEAARLRFAKEVEAGIAQALGETATAALLGKRAPAG